MGPSDTPSKRRFPWLASIPLGVGLVFGVTTLPRAAVPDAVPLPRVDSRAFAARVKADGLLADGVRREPLRAEVRALGSALRDFHLLEAKQATAPELHAARRALDNALLEVLEGGSEPLLRLRAVQLESFVAEVFAFERSGVESEELLSVAGPFVRRMRREGWLRGKTLVPRQDEWRVLFKGMWNALLGLEGRAEFAPTLDEQRVLYAFYLAHPHPSEANREALLAARRGVGADRARCDALDIAERLAAESWRLERVQRLAALDASYPGSYARGVALYRRGDYLAAAEAFRDWLRDHPEGPWSGRAESYLRACLAASRVNP